MSPSVAKRCPLATQARAQLAVVVDLAVEDDGDRAVLVVDRLVAGGEVDHAQPLDPEPDRAVDVDAARIGAAVLEAGAHRRHQLARRPGCRRCAPVRRCRRSSTSLRRGRRREGSVGRAGGSARSGGSAEAEQDAQRPRLGADPLARGGLERRQRQPQRRSAAGARGPARRGSPAPEPAVVLAGEERARVGELGHQVAAVAAAGVVGHRHQRQVADVPAGLVGPQAPVDLLRVEEEALVHRADRRRSPRPGRRGRRRPPSRPRPRAGSARRRISSSCSDLKTGQRAAKSDSPRSLRGRGEAAHRELQLAVGAALDDAGDADVRPRVERRDQLGEVALEDLDVGVEQEDVAALRPGDADVVAGGEAAVGDAQHLDVVELALDRLRRAVGRGAVGDDPLALAVRRARPRAERSVRSAISRPLWVTIDDAQVGSAASLMPAPPAASPAAPAPSTRPALRPRPRRCTSPP